MEKSTHMNNNNNSERQSSRYANERAGELAFPFNPNGPKLQFLYTLTHRVQTHQMCVRVHAVRASDTTEKKKVKSRTLRTE